MPRTLRTGRRHRGAIAVEFALMALLLIPAVVFVIEFGRSLYAYDVLAKSVRSAARYLAVGAPADANRQAEATCIVMTGSPARSGGSCSGTLQLQNLTAGMVTIVEPSQNGGTNAVNAIATGAGQMNAVTVSVSGYPLGAIAAILFPTLSFGPISVTVPYIFF